jgi:AcrR family transcriptional regulator
MMRGVPVQKLTPERRRQMTRDALVEAAAEVFAKKGVNGASMEEIAAEAGFTRGAIYSNFGSKEELLLAVMDRFIDRQLAEFAEGVVVDSEDPVGVARSAGGVFKRTLSLELMPLELELRLNALRNPEARRRLAEADRRTGEKMARFIEDQVVAQGIRLKIPPRDVGDIGRAAIQGLLQYAATDEQGAERYEGLVETLFVLLAGAAFEPEDSEKGTGHRPGS